MIQSAIKKGLLIVFAMMVWSSASANVIDSWMQDTCEPLLQSGYRTEVGFLSSYIQYNNQLGPTHVSQTVYDVFNVNDVKVTTCYVRNHVTVANDTTPPWVNTLITSIPGGPSIPPINEDTKKLAPWLNAAGIGLGAIAACGATSGIYCGIAIGGALLMGGSIVLDENSPASVAINPDFAEPPGIVESIKIPFYLAGASDGDALAIYLNSEMVFKQPLDGLEANKIYVAEIPGSVLVDGENARWILWLHSAGESGARVIFPAGLDATLENDSDLDGVSDANDNCIFSANGDVVGDAGGKFQLDTDLDGIGNACDADLNNDGLVTVSDFVIFRPKLNSQDENSDLNGDGLVTVSDFLILRGQLNGPPGPSAIVPEEP